VRVYPIAVRLRQTLSGARSQALPGNVFLAALPPVQFVGGRATSENVPRQSLGTSTGETSKIDVRVYPIAVKQVKILL